MRHLFLLYLALSRWHILLVAKPALWIIELHNGQDNRLTADLVDHGLKPALDIVEKEWRTLWRAAQKAKDKDGGKGALIIIGKQDQDKFFSNGELLKSLRKG